MASAGTERSHSKTHRRCSAIVRAMESGEDGQLVNLADALLELPDAGEICEYLEVILGLQGRVKFWGALYEGLKAAEGSGSELRKKDVLGGITVDLMQLGAMHGLESSTESHVRRPARRGVRHRRPSQG